MEKMIIKCPGCNEETVWSETNPYRPFCGKKCQILDLGDWLSEKYSIAGSEQAISSNGETEET